MNFTDPLIVTNVGKKKNNKLLNDISNKPSTSHTVDIK